MKKLFAFIICFLFIGIVNAEKCIVVSGDGSHPGDEIKCGTESFYVLEANNETTRLFAKYNLMVGDTINFIPATDDEVDEFYADQANVDKDFCEALAEDNGFHPYYTYPMYDFNTNDFTGCRVYEKINYEHAVQDPRAEGTVLVNGKSKLPLYGITYMVPEWGYEAIHNNNIKENAYDRKGDLIIDDSSFEKYLLDYQRELERQNIHTEDVSFITIKGMKDFIEEISGREFELNLSYIQDPQSIPDYYTLKMNIKDYVPEKFSWLYENTYWIGSGFRYEDQNNFDSHSEYNDFYISNEGFLCALGRGECGYFDYPIGNGLRPAVTVLTKDINFIIETKTDGHGKVEAEKIQAHGGEVVKFTVTPDEGYVLGQVKVTDALGNVVVFTDYTFTMPNANVLIEATFVKGNPETADINLILITGLALLSFTGILFYYKKLQKN